MLGAGKLTLTFRKLRFIPPVWWNLQRKGKCYDNLFFVQTEQYISTDGVTVCIFQNLNFVWE